MQINKEEIDKDVKKMSLNEMFGTLNDLFNTARNAKLDANAKIIYEAIGSSITEELYRRYTID